MIVVVATAQTTEMTSHQRDNGLGIDARGVEEHHETTRDRVRTSVTDAGFGRHAICQMGDEGWPPA
jgi:hypothetical protein